MSPFTSETAIGPDVATSTLARVLAGFCPVGVAGGGPAGEQRERVRRGRAGFGGVGGHGQSGAGGEWEFLEGEGEVADDGWGKRLVP